MTSTERNIEATKKSIEEHHRREFTLEENLESQGKMGLLAELMFRIWQEDERRNKKLLEFPNGFQLDGAGYICSICSNLIATGKNWFDKKGIKCPICQNAIDRKEIPLSLLKNKDSWYSGQEIEDRFNIKKPMLLTWIKKGILKVRTVTNYGKGVHLQVFLIKENKDFLPPKKLTKPRMIQVIQDGKAGFHSEPWYRAGVSHSHLKDYKIMNYFRMRYQE